MQFEKHSELKDLHAFLSPSKYHWIRYDDEKLTRTFLTAMASARGTRLHAIAAELIEMGIPLPRTRGTLNSYVNDAIGFKMTPEVILKYSRNAFGTCDAISFRKNTLRIHDLKNGETRTSMDQLMVYVALFCLEYKIRPSSIKIELRIYQTGEILVHHPELDDIVHIMDKIVTFDKLIERIREEES